MLNPAQIVVCVVNVSMNVMMLTVELGPDDSSCSYCSSDVRSERHLHRG